MDSTPSTGQLQISEVARYGTEDGAGWISNIAAVAVNDSLLAVSTATSCEIVIYSRRRQSERGRFGQCGEGPDDFLEMGALGFRGDTLLVTDRRGRRLRYLGNEGSILKTIILDSVALPQDSRSIVSLTSWRDAAFVLSVRLGAHGYQNNAVIPRNPLGSFVRIVPTAGQGRSIALLVDGVGVSRTNYGEQRSTAACVLESSGASKRAFLVALNKWRSQAVVLDMDSLAHRQRATAMNRLLLQIPIGSFDGRDLPSKMLTHRFALACGGAVAVGVYQLFNSTDPKSNLSTGAYLVAIDPSSRAHTIRHVSGEIPAVLGNLVAAHGDSFFFAHNSRFDFPQVVEMRILQK